ncbi:MAG TPA: fasciclin domain-containing protein [Chitinophagaceae bacterium]|nr:fasciclin domain-containing protein [Chitinophagaceae bacterium]
MATILQIANADRNLSTLIKGLKAAALEDSLNGVGPFTILAPINLAFGNMNAASFDDLVKQSSNNSKLADILTYHILKGKKLLRDFRDGQKIATINGKELSITVKDGEVRINGAKILARDRQGSNGVIHSIDAVNIPE